MFLEGFFKKVFGATTNFTLGDKKNNGILVFFISVATFFTLFQYAYYVSKVACEGDFTDFGHYYFYSTIVREGHNPFDLDVVRRFEKSLNIAYMPSSPNYPPFYYAILMRPFTYLQYPHAKILWLILNQLFLLASLILCMRVIKEKLNILVFATILYLALNFYPLLVGLYIGQSNVLILFFISCAFYLFKKGHDFFGGISLALAICTKPQMGLLLLFFILKKEYKIVFSAIVASAAFLGISFFFTAAGHWPDFMQYIYRLRGDASNLAWVANQSLTGLFYRLFNISIKEGVPTLPVYYSPITGRILSFLSSAAVLLVGVFFWKQKTPRNTDKINLEFSLAIVTCLLLSPLTEEHHFVWLLMVFIFMMPALLDGKVNFLATCVLAISYVLIGYRFYLGRFAIFNKGIMTLFHSIKLYALILLWVIVIYSLYKELKNNLSKTGM